MTDPNVCKFDVSGGTIGAGHSHSHDHDHGHSHSAGEYSHDHAIEHGHTHEHLDHAGELIHTTNLIVSELSIAVFRQIRGTRFA